MSLDESIARLGDVTPSELVAGEDTAEVTRTAPISHGAGVSWVLDDDLDLYDELRAMWREEVGEPDGAIRVDYSPSFLPDSGDYVLEFYSSGWKAGRDGGHGWSRWYKYHLTLRRKTEPVDGEPHYVKPATSLNVVVEPQREGLTYEDGNELHLPYGEGSRISVQTTYVERGSRAVNRGLEALEDALDAVDHDADLAAAGKIKRPSCRIWKAETYLRFDVDQKHRVVRCIDNSEDLVDVGGGAEISTYKERQREGWLEARVTTDRWTRLGFDPLEVDPPDDAIADDPDRLDRELKVYQAQDWHERPRDDPLHHPKIEASLDGGQRNPHLDEWDDVMARLRELVVGHLEWAGVDDDELVADDYLDPEIQPRLTYDHPEGRREDLRRYYNRFETVIWSECLKAQTTAPYDILSVLVERNGATYDELEAATGFSRSNLQYHVGRLRDLGDTGLVETIGNPAVVVFDSERLLDLASELLDDKIAPHFGEETLARRRLGREERADERREARENGDAPGTSSPDDAPDDPVDVDDHLEDAPDDVDDGRAPFTYLEEWYGTPQMIMDQLVDDDHPRTERDVRVRQLDPPD